MESIFKRVNFDFFVYQVYHERASDKFFVNTFKVTAPGHVLAQAVPGDHPESFNGAISRNELLSYWRCSKRVGAMSSDAEPGRCDYMGRNEITRQQAEYFAARRQMNA